MKQRHKETRKDKDIEERSEKRKKQKYLEKLHNNIYFLSHIKWGEGKLTHF